MAKQKKQLDDLTPIELYSESRDRKESFPKKQAEKILTMGQGGKWDWQLSDEKLEFKNGVINRPSTGATQSAEEQTDDK